MQHLLALFVIVGFSCLITASAEEYEYIAGPVSLIVDPGTVNLRRRLKRLYREGKYDDVFRYPNDPDGSAIVHCAKTYRIGAILRIRRSSTEPLGRRYVHVRHEWTHGELDNRSGHVNDVHVLLFPRRVTTKSNIELQRIEGLTRDDGVWTLRSYIGEELIAEASFNLIDCAGNFVEIDISDPPSPEELLAAEAAAAAAAAAALAEEEEEKVVCRKEALTGSHVKVDVCRTRTEIDRRREQDQKLVRDIQSTPVERTD